MKASLLSIAVAALTVLAATMAQAKSGTTYVAPGPTESLSVQNQEYLIGVVSFALVIVAGVMGVKAMTDINYDDDTLLMVEVPEDAQHEEQQ